MRDERKPRIALAGEDIAPLAGIRELLDDMRRYELIWLEGPYGTLWRDVMKASPDVTVFYMPEVGVTGKSCLHYLLRGSLTHILVITNTPQALEDISSPKLEVVCNKHKDEPIPVRAVVDGVYALAVRADAAREARATSRSAAQKSEDTSHEPLVALGQISRAVLDSSIVAVGASTGGPDAIARMFKLLPAKMPGIVVVQHMPPGFPKMLAERLDRDLPFRVREAEGGERVLPGTVYIAPGDRHLTVRRRSDGFYTVVEGTEKRGGHCPSADVLFESVAREAGTDAVGIILTGMGKDGASGLVEMKKRGAFNVGQDEATSVVYGMPQKALEYGGLDRVAPLLEIPGVIVDHLIKKGMKT